MTIDSGSIGELFEASQTGPFMIAEIIPLRGIGKLRVTCNWLYSSLNCDPRDASPFLWQFNTVDATHISLSPMKSCIGQPIYASVRDDLDFYVQVQAPYSADWITSVQRDEIIGMTMHDMNIAQLSGFNGSNIIVCDDQEISGNHSGYRIRSVGTSFAQDAQWFIKFSKSLQREVSFSNAGAKSLHQQLTDCSISIDVNTFSDLQKQTGL